ncbi:unnamed protein product, partial [Rodentolepis nana]|uniref:Homeobox domain-containing protein n=1 Tax=Rodentolepis nana TaxID=102285 RepID=A0A0R3TF54_RODNA
MDRHFDPVYFELNRSFLFSSPDSPILDNFGKSPFDMPRPCNPIPIAPQSFPILESLLDEVPEVGVQASRNTAQTGRQLTAKFLTHSHTAPSQSILRRALTDPSYLERKLDELKVRNLGIAKPERGVKQWVAKYFPSEAQAPKLSQVTTPLASMPQDKRLQSPCIFSRHFAGAPCTCSVENLQQSSTPSENPPSHIPVNAMPSTGALPSIQEIFKRPKTPPPIPRPNMTRNTRFSSQSLP